MAQNKTIETIESVANFLATVTDENKKQDCLNIVTIMEKVTGFKAKMWGPSIVGFGSYHYKYESGREGDAPLVGFSPRKNEISLYLSSSFKNRDGLLEKFGKHKSAKACVYIKKLADIDQEIFKEMIVLSVKHVKSMYP